MIKRVCIFIFCAALSAAQEGKQPTPVGDNSMPIGFGGLQGLQSWVDRQPRVGQKELFAFEGQQYFVVIRDGLLRGFLQPRILVYEQLAGWTAWRLAVMRSFVEGKPRAEKRGAEIVFVDQDTKKVVLIVPMDIPRGGPNE